MLSLRVRLGRLLVLVDRIVLRVYVPLLLLLDIRLVLLLFLQISFMYSSLGRILVVGVFPLVFIICGILFRISLL